MKQNGVFDDALRLSLFPHSLTHHAIACESLEVVRQLEMMNKKFLEMMRQFQTVKTVDTKCETCGGPHSFTEFPAVSGYTQETAYATMAITTRSGVSYDGPPIPPPTSSLPKVMERVPEVTKDTVQPRTYISSLVLQTLNNKEKLFDLATTSVNENCSTVILKKLPEKLGDRGKFLIPCDFPELDKCLALVDLGASINLMPLFICRKLSLLELTPTRMILELADRSTTRPAGIAEDVFVKVGKFHFLTDFVVIDYVVDPRARLILKIPFLRTGRALIDVYGKELTLRDDDEAITFKVGQTSKYSYNDVESVNQIYVIDVAYEEYVQEVLGFSEIPKSGSPTPTLDPIISSSSPSFTPFEGSDFILEEIKTEGYVIYTNTQDVG
nr:reverse transcriptase domain-containing protein [Tanacetum cinerariifolium]